MGETLLDELRAGDPWRTVRIGLGVPGTSRADYLTYYVELLLFCFDDEQGPQLERWFNRCQVLGK